MDSNRRWIDTGFIETLTDDFSIWQHATKDGIDRAHGYAVDDATRALLVAIAYNKPGLGAIYLSCIHHACCDFSQPVNFFTKERTPIHGEFSADALGQVLWAIQEINSLGLDIKKAEELEATIVPYIESAVVIRPFAYAALGNHEQLTEMYISRVLTGYKKHNAPNWQWPEPELRYGNALLPLALLHTGTNQELALTMLNFLNQACTEQGKPIAIGNDGWYRKGESKSLFAQQPIDPAYQVLANCLAYKKTGDTIWKQEAEKFLNWFWGFNLLEISLIDLHNGRCKDALEKTRASTNNGAESTVCYLLAQAAYKEIEAR